MGCSELVKELVLKTSARKGMWVRVPPPPQLTFLWVLLGLISMGIVSGERGRIKVTYKKLPKIGGINQFSWPKLGNDLAELVGILLGDGGITERQISITLNAIADRDYAIYVSNLIANLFSQKPSVYFRRGENSVRLSVSGVELVKFLERMGLKIGDKVRQQVKVPDWIVREDLLSKSCLRGLIDTDGCIFLRKDSKGREKYSYANLYFSNLSQPLRVFVYETLLQFGFKPRYFGNNHVRLYSQRETLRYLEVIGSSNTRIFRWIKRANQ